MGNSYTFTTGGNIQSGSIIRAEDFTSEFNALQSAFDSSGGHKHNGDAGEGGRVEVVGPAGQLVVTASALTGSSSKLLNLGTSSNLLLDVFIADDKKINFGDAQDATIKYDETTSDTLLFEGANIRINNTNKIIEFRDADLKIHSSTNGQLDIDADVELEIVAPTVDIQAETAITLVSDAITFGENGNTDIVLSFNASTSDGTLTWMEDEAHFKFSDDIVVDSTKKIYFNDEGGEHISGDATDLTITSGNDLNLTATTDINIPANVGLTFGNDAEKIEGDGTDLTISGNNINLTAVADVNIPVNVGLTFDTAEKIESDGTDLNITVGSGGDINIPANIGMTFGNDGEKIEGDGTDLTITGNNINLTATADVVIPADVGITFGSGEKIEGDNTDLTVTSGNDINLTATGTVNLNTDTVGLHFGANEDVTLTHVHDTGLLLNSTRELQFGSSSTKVHQSSSGVLDLTATTVQVSNDLHLNTDGAVLAFGADNADNLPDIRITHISPSDDFAVDSGLSIISTNVNANAGPVLVLDRNNNNSAVNDIIGSVQFKGDNTSNASVIMGEIKTKITDTTAGNEDSDVIISNIIAGTPTAQLTLSATGVTANVGFTNAGNSSTSGNLVVSADADADDLTGDSAVGRLTLGAGEDLNLYHGGTNSYIVNDTGDLFIDTAGDIVLDADGGDIIFKDDGTSIGSFTNSSSDFVITSSVQDKDILFKGDDNGSPVTALTLDMSEAGKATFSQDINVPGEVQTTKIAFTDGDDAMTVADGGSVTFADDVTVTGRAVPGTAPSPASGTSGTVTFDLSENNNFTLSPSGAINDLGFTNQSTSVGQSGTIKLYLASAYAITPATTVAINTDTLTAIQAAGTYMLTYFVTQGSGNNSIYISASGALT